MAMFEVRSVDRGEVWKSGAHTISSRGNRNVSKPFVEPATRNDMNIFGNEVILCHDFELYIRQLEKELPHKVDIGEVGST